MKVLTILESVFASIGIAMPVGAFFLYRITVPIERDNPKRYLVDPSFLPKLAQ